jgi:hypothetical protein
MTLQDVSHPEPASPRLSARLFAWAFTACALFTPVALVVYAFTTSPDAVERAQIVVQGLTTTVITLALALAVRAVYGWGVLPSAREQQPDGQLPRPAVSV